MAWSSAARLRAVTMLSSISDGAAVSGLSSTVNALALAASLSAASAAGETGDLVTISVATLPAVARNRWRLRLGGAVLDQRRDGKADQTPGLVHFAGRIPAAHREQAVRIEPAEKALPGLDRVEAVLGQREGAGARRRPGVDQAHLYDVEGAWRACEPAACLVDLEPHPVQCRDRRVVGEASRRTSMMIGLISTPVTSLDAEEAVRQHVAAAADADDGACLADSGWRRRGWSRRSAGSRGFRGYRRSRYMAVPAPPSMSSDRCSTVERGRCGDAPNIAGGTVSFWLTVMREKEFQRS